MEMKKQSFKSTPDEGISINGVPISMVTSFQTNHTATDDGRATVTITFDVDELVVKSNTDFI